MICSFNECNNHVFAKALCRAHYEQQRTKKPLAELRKYPRPEKNACLILACNNLGYVRGLCGNHYRLARVHNCTEAEFIEYLNIGKCESCGSVEPRMHLDHNHITGKIRGLLCGQCNMTLGLMKDDPNKIRGLIKYLEDR